MSLAAIIDALIAAGGTMDQISAVAHAHEDAAVASKPRSAAAIRQARYRAKTSQTITRDVTHNECDGCDGCDAPFSDKEIPHTPKEINSNQDNPSPPKGGSVPGTNDEIEPAFSEFNRIAESTGWPKAQRLTDQRKTGIRKRLADAGGLNGWKSAMERAARSSFLSGSTGWKADLDFFLQSKSFNKLMEGSYDDVKPSGQSMHQRGPEFSRSAADQVLSGARRRAAKIDTGRWASSERSVDLDGNSPEDDFGGGSVRGNYDRQAGSFRIGDGDVSTLVLSAPSLFGRDH